MKYYSAMRKKECYHLDLEGIMLNKSEKNIVSSVICNVWSKKAELLKTENLMVVIRDWVGVVAGLGRCWWKSREKKLQNTVRRKQVTKGPLVKLKSLC